MRKLIVAALALLTLNACTPADEQYCNSMGVGGTAEWGKCMAYYHEQDEAFKSDRAECSLRADMTYPQSLYDRGGYITTFYGGPYFGGPFGGPFGPSGGSAFVEPDYRKNAEVDSLRMRIIAPCMEAKGWNSPSNWQAGRHKVVAPKKANGSAPAGSLPWLQ